MIVIDASAALSIVIPDENDSGTAVGALVSASPSIAPAIFPAEIANALHFAHKAGRITAADATHALDRFSRLSIYVESSSFDLRDELRLAKKHGLTIYDAMYLAIGCSRRLPILTLDRALTKAARSEGLSLAL